MGTVERMISAKTGIATGLVVLGAVFPTAACGGGDEHAEHPSAAATTTEESGPPHNSADVTFAQAMIPHHQQALALAALVPDRSTNPEIVKIAAGIAAQQEPEMTAMRAMMIQWQVEPAGTPHHGGAAGSANQDGMVDDATMAKLKTLKGAQFDTLWLQSMISHHQGAVAMAKVEIADGESKDMKVMANNIVITQEAEIGELKQILEGE